MLEKSFEEKLKEREAAIRQQWAAQSKAKKIADADDSSDGLIEGKRAMRTLTDEEHKRIYRIVCEITGRNGVEGFCNGKRKTDRRFCSAPCGSSRWWWSCRRGARGQQAYNNKLWPCHIGPLGERALPCGRDAASFSRFRRQDGGWEAKVNHYSKTISRPGVSAIASAQTVRSLLATAPAFLNVIFQLQPYSVRTS